MFFRKFSINHVLYTGDCSIKDGKLGIHMTMSREGRPSGEAYVEMESDEDIEKACKKDRDHMGHRYIEGTCLCSQFCIGRVTLSSFLNTYIIVNIGLVFLLGWVVHIAKITIHILCLLYMLMG
jgi:hypothetical protein